MIVKQPRLSRWIGLLILAVLVGSAAIGLIAITRQTGEAAPVVDPEFNTAFAQPTDIEEGEQKKAWSGISLAERTLVADTPSASSRAAGFDTERVISGYDDWEPTVAVDPNSAYVYQMTTRYNDPRVCPQCASPVMIFRRSKDGGATWEPDHLLATTRRSQNDPQVKVAEDGTVFTAWMNDYVPGIRFMKSLDHGSTWTRPIMVANKGAGPNWSDKPILAISRSGRDVYIAFNSSDHYVVASHDGGDTFAEPIKLSADQRYWFDSGGVVAANGDVYFAAADYTQDYTGDSNIDVAKSTDGGRTWITTRVDTSARMPDCPWAAGCYLGFIGPADTLAIDRAGLIMLAYNAGDVAGSPERMYVRTSRDGVNWSARQEVSNGSSTVNNAFPALAAGNRPGDFRLIWMDDRNGSTTEWNTWYRRTTDSGLTWSADVRVSDLGSGAPYKNAAGFSFPYGDYNGIAVDAQGVNHIIWGEGISYTGPGGSWYTRGQ